MHLGRRLSNGITWPAGGALVSARYVISLTDEHLTGGDVPVERMGRCREGAGRGMRDKPLEVTMIKHIVLAAATAALSVAIVSPASAQDFNADPNYGTVDLTTGFTPDPQVVAVRSGGEIDAAESITSSCQGFISYAPDVRLIYKAGTLPLIISVASSADTTLVINGPDGRWYCDDDGGVNGLNPMVRFSSPQSGRYEIWIGTYGNASLQPAQLHISELTSQ